MNDRANSAALSDLLARVEAAEWPTSPFAASHHPHAQSDRRADMTNSGETLADLTRLKERAAQAVANGYMDHAARDLIHTLAQALGELERERDEARTQHASHLGHVQEWLCSLYAIMIDPCALDSEAPIEVMNACRQLELAAVEQREQLAACLAAEDRALAAEARVTRLVEGLEPFAQASDACDEPTYSDTMSAWETPQAMAVTIGDFRRARALLPSAGGEAPVE